MTSKKTEFELADELMQQQDTVVGYQYSPTDGAFIGEYEFPNNKDRFEVALPPNTTLEAPPSAQQKGMRAFFRAGAWVVDGDAHRISPPKIAAPEGPFTVQVPFLVRTKKMVKPDKDSPEVEIEELAWESVSTTIEEVVQKAKSVEELFREQARLFGLEDD